MQCHLVLQGPTRVGQVGRRQHSSLRFEGPHARVFSSARETSTAIFSGEVSCTSVHGHVQMVYSKACFSRARLQTILNNSSLIWTENTLPSTLKKYLSAPGYILFHRRSSWWLRRWFPETSSRPLCLLLRRCPWNLCIFLYLSSRGTRR